MQFEIGATDRRLGASRVGKTDLVRQTQIRGKFYDSLNPWRLPEPFWTPTNQPATRLANETHNKIVLCTLGVTYIITYILCSTEKLS